MHFKMEDVQIYKNQGQQGNPNLKSIKPKLILKVWNKRCRQQDKTVLQEEKQTHLRVEQVERFRIRNQRGHWCRGHVREGQVNSAGGQLLFKIKDKNSLLCDSGSGEGCPNYSTKGQVGCRFFVPTETDGHLHLPQQPGSWKHIKRGVRQEAELEGSRINSEKTKYRGS